MPNTALGITYPDSSGHTRLWEHLQTLAQTTDSAVTLATPRGYSADIPADSAAATITSADVAGLTVDVPTTSAGGFLIVTITWDLNVTAFTSTTAVSGTCVVDGSTQTGSPVWTVTAAGQRNTIGRSWYVPVGPGTHTVKGQFRISAATLTVSCRALDTGLTVMAVG